VEVSRFEKLTAAASLATLILTYLILAATVHWPPFDSAANGLDPSPAAAAITPSTSSPLTTAATPSDAVSVSGVFGARPNVGIPNAQAPTHLEFSTLIQGRGQAMGNGAAVLANFVLYAWNGQSHKLLSNTFSTAPALLTNPLLPGLQTALRGQDMGSRLLAVLPPQAAFGSAGNPGAGVSAGDTLVFVIDLIAQYQPTAAAAGTPVSDGGGQLPTVTAASGGAPTVSIPSSSAPPGDFAVKTLIRGNGPAVRSGQAVIVQYSGLIWRTGKVFGSSWSAKQPFSFQIGTSPAQVIPCWDTGLRGVSVGSRVLLVCPPAYGYGAAGESSAGITGTDTLIFVVDILGAYNPA
jgi:FKBP-type peptidyl-prolyl cis-trans isomerase